MKKAVIFDLDGTLLDTLGSIAHCCNTALREFSLAEIDKSVYPQFVGRGAKVLADSVFKYSGAPDEIYDAFIKRYFEIYEANGTKGVDPYDGVKELLSELKARGVRAAVLSNKPHVIARDVCSQFFGELTDPVYGQRDGVPTKPDPTAAFELMGELGVSAKECVYCGDSGVDVETGKNAGIFTVGAAWGFYGDKPFSRADAIAYKPEDILKYL